VASIGQILLAGLSLGSVYALTALGFVLIYRATNVVNFAQGEFLMLGAYFLFTFVEGAKLNYGVAALIAFGMLGVLGLLFALGIYYPLRNRSFLPVIIATIGASIMFQNGALAIWGSSPERLRPVLEVAAPAASPSAACSSTTST